MPQYDEDFKEKEQWDQIRIRNLKINIAKVLINMNEEEKKCFSREELKERFGFKERDILYLSDKMFDIDDENYILKTDVAQFLKKVIDSNKVVMAYLASAEAEFLRIYGRYHEKFMNNSHFHYSYVEYQEMFDRIKEIIPIIHWGYLPIFNKYLVYNRELDPEREMIEFYDHIDCLNVLLNEIKGQGKKLDNASDLSLNRIMDIKIYSRRREHVETCNIKRTIDGWHCIFPSTEGKCEKDGEGAFFDYLVSESIFYPQDGVAYAMTNLWEDADEGEINYEELSNRIQQIGEWISTIEKTIDCQPEWLCFELNDHADCLETPMKDTKDSSSKVDNKNDSTLNKEMRFSVYSRRWGHKDTYTIERTTDGWNCSFLAINGKCTKNGEGGLFNNLDHDCIFYSKDGVAYAMEKLWEDADKGIIGFEELKSRIQQVANWISIIEKSMSAQPEWVHYY